MDYDKTLGELVRRNETNYISGTTTISKYVDFSLSENIAKIDAYLNSRHISGATDSMEREKPFFNIVTAAVNIWYRATDIDRKDIKIRANKLKEVVPAFLATIHLQNWMRKENFGAFLNDWGRTLARYGSAVVKFIENDGELHSMVIPWNRLIVDQVDFDNDVVIEVLELSPSELRNRKGYDKEIVDKLIETTSTRQTLDKQNKDTQANFIRLYEVHGEMPLSYLTGKDKDDDSYCQQMHVISFVAGKDNGKYDDFCLYKGKEAKNPYMITHLIKEDGRTQSIGAVENLFEAQWMLNHTTKQIKDQLDLASKLIFQTSDGNFVGQNALNSIETGDILIHAVNQPLTQVANNSHDITSLQNYGSQWKQLGTEINGISEAMLGQGAKSGTAWRQTEALLNESHSLFEMMIENKGIYIEQMLRTYVIPFLKKKMDTSKEIAATLDYQNINKLNSMYLPSELIRRDNEQIKRTILSGGIAQNLDPMVLEQDITKEMNSQGNQRFFKPSEVGSKTWKEFFKDLEWEIEIDVTGEQSDDKSDMATLASVFQTVASLQGQPMSEEAKLLFNKILMKTSTVSPLELSDLKPAQPVNPVAPTVGGSTTGSGISNLTTK
jgi:hypothetical protein